LQYSCIFSKELEKIGVMLIHRRKIQWILRDEKLETNNLKVIDWMKKEMKWPSDVVDSYSKTFGSYEYVSDLQKLSLEVGGNRNC
jgi:hypothetical protein